MRKALTLSAVSLYISTLILSVSAQTSEPSNAQGGATLIGEVIAVVAVIAVFSVLAYAGFKVIKKWSGSSQSD